MKTNLLLGALLALISLPTVTAEGPHPCDPPSDPDPDQYVQSAYCLALGTYYEVDDLLEDFLDGGSIVQAIRDFRTSMEDCVDDYLTFQPAECDYGDP